MTITKAVYKGKIHNAVVESGERDPYTGQALDWALISKWDTSHAHPEGYKRRFALMPTVDHITPAVLEFEICSWQINVARSSLEELLLDYEDFLRQRHLPKWAPDAPEALAVRRIGQNHRTDPTDLSDPSDPSRQLGHEHAVARTVPWPNPDRARRRLAGERMGE